MIAAMRVFHIGTGGIALVVAPLAMATVKGGRAHRMWGKVYFWAMAAVSLSAAIIAIWRPLVFLGLLSIFSFYSAFRGYRILTLKKSPASLLDWSAAAGLLAAGVGLVILAIWTPASIRLPSPMVALVFGLLAAKGAISDMRSFSAGAKIKMGWWYAHMEGMLVSYIAALTAFSAVNFESFPRAIVWLWPTAVGAPIIMIWTSYYRRKFAEGGEPKVSV